MSTTLRDMSDQKWVEPVRTRSHLDSTGSDPTAAPDVIRLAITELKWTEHDRDRSLPGVPDRTTQDQASLDGS